VRDGHGSCVPGGIHSGGEYLVLGEGYLLEDRFIFFRRFLEFLFDERLGGGGDLGPHFGFFLGLQGAVLVLLFELLVDELLLVVKTRAALLPELEKLVKSIHPYTVPEIIAMPIIGGNSDYLGWIEKETA